MSRRDRARAARPGVQSAPVEPPQPRQQPSAIKLVLIVALIVAVVATVVTGLDYARQGTRLHAAARSVPADDRL